MSVIGRLDEQVEDVLIRPVSERPRAQTPDATPPRQGEKLTRRPPPEDSKSPEAAGDGPPAGDDDAHPKEDLPVWML